MSEFNESSYEKSIIELFENLGYNYVYGPDVDRKLTDPLMEDELRGVLEIINPGLPKAAIDEVVYKLRNYEVGSLVSKNETFMDYLQNGIQVSYREKNEQTGNWDLWFRVNFEFEAKPPIVDGTIQPFEHVTKQGMQYFWVMHADRKDSTSEITIPRNCFCRALSIRRSSIFQISSLNTRCSLPNSPFLTAGTLNLTRAPRSLYTSAALSSAVR